MKTKFSRRAKSVVSILLTLCMVLSVFTIAISSASAATAEDESVGATTWHDAWQTVSATNFTMYFDNSLTQWESVKFKIGRNWKYDSDAIGYSIYDMTLVPGTDYIYSVTVDSWSKYNDFYFVNGGTAGWHNNSSVRNSDSQYTAFTTPMNFNLADSNFGKTFMFVGDESTVGTAAAPHETGVTGITGKGTVNSIDPTNNPPSSTNGSYFKNIYKENVTVAANDHATVTAAYTYGDGGSLTNGQSSGDSKVLSGSTVTVTVEPEAGYVLTGITVTSANNAASTTLSNSGDSTFVTGRSTSTITATVSPATPQYCITGNYLNPEWGSPYLFYNETTGKYDTVRSVTTPTGTDNWFNTWQDNYVIGDSTGTTGVYSLTFKVKDDYEYNPKLCIYLKDVGQKAYIYNGTPYNTTSNDLTVPDAGIADNLYAYDLAASNAGGSLVLKPGQTYTITIDQTQCYDSTSPYGKITITTTDAYVDTVAKKKNYNATDRQYDSASDAAVSIGTASSSPYHGTKSGFTSRLTATEVNNNYTFTGWYDNAECTGTAVSTSKTYDVVNPGNSVTYYALFTQAMPTDYNVAITNQGGTISLTGGVDATGTSDSTAYAGATVGLKIENIDHAKEFKSWKITSTQSGYDVTSSVLNAGATASSASFIMPPYDVTVTAVLGAKTPVSITVTSNDNTRGTASYTENTYYVGDEIQLSATNGTGVFTKWQITGANFKTGSTATTQNPVIIPTGTTVTAKAFFDYKTYQLYYKNDRYLPMIRQSDGTYVSTSAISYGTDKYFTIYDANDRTYAITASDPYELGSNWLSGGVSSWNSTKGNQYRLKSGSSSYYVIFDPAGNSGTGTVSIIDTDSNPMGYIATIYAKDGSIRYRQGGSNDGTTAGDSSGLLWDDPDWSNQDKDSDHRGRMTCLKGTTEITAIDTTTVKDPDYKRYPGTYKTRTGTNTFTETSTDEHLKVYSAPIGSTITIKTTVDDTYKNQGFYVGMFVINGWKVAATKTSDGVYTATYTLSDDYDVENLDSTKSFEITPVYYNSNFEYITFYVDADSVPSDWGNTISACADYNGAYYPHFEGSYPGQPLGREGDLYELKVAKYYYSYSGGKWTAQTNYHPSATITAYNYDSVHHYYYVYKDENVNTSNNKNLQTYDYSDFTYLAQIEDIEAILFRCKYYAPTAKSGWQIYNKNDNDANYNAKTPSWFFVDDKYTQFNEWQVLTDYYGNPIDALGNRIPKDGGGYYTSDDLSSIAFTANDTNQIRIVSYGNRNTGSDSANSRTAARWASGWAVFGGGSTNGTNYQIAYGTPADFICTTPGDASTSNVHYLNSKSYTDLYQKITFISYDKERTNQVSGVGDTGQRSDGQWYYSAKHEFSSNVKVAITTGTAATLTTSNTAIETDDNASDETAGFKGHDSGTLAKLDGNTVHTYNNTTTNAELACSLGSGYTFVGWYIFDGSTYTKIGDNYADLNTTMQMKKNYTIVAVVKAVGKDDLVITHSRYTGSKPEAHTGTGKYYVSAKIYDSDGTTLKRTIDEAQNSITIPSVLTTDKIQITLRTVCDGADTFYAWYEEALGENYARTGNYYEICAEDKDPLGEKQVSYEFFMADCSTFFNSTTNKLARNTLDFYSDIIHVSAFANLTYKYYDRFAANGKGNMVSYTVKNVPLTNAEIENGYIPGDDKITKYAPNVVDTIYTDTKWAVVGTKVERMASNVTLMATQEDKECYVQYIPYDNVGEELLQDLSTETGVGDVAEWTNTKVPFNSWLVNGEKDMSNWDPSDFIVSAPQTYSYTSGGTTTTWTFVRFDVYAVNRTSGAIGDLIYSSNDNIFGYRIYADCAIYPVYEKAEVTKQLTAKIEPAVLNREVYGDSTNPTDRLYADLIISFMNLTAVSDGPTTNVIKEIESTSGFTIETGVILDKSVNLSSADYNTLKTAGAAKGTDTTATVIASYNTLIGTEHVTALAANDTAYTGLAKYKVKDNSDMTNKNRIDKVLKFTNSTTSGVQEKVYFAYSYIVIKKDGNVIATAISAPQKFNFAYIGNKPLETVSGS